MFDPRAILAQVSRDEADEEWLIRRAKDETAGVTIAVSFFVVILGFPMLIVFTIVIASLGFAASDPFYLLFHSPWLLFPALTLSAAFIYAVWRSEKNKRDAILILVPEGIVECERLSNERKRRITFFEYSSLEEITVKVERGDISIHLSQMRKPHAIDYIPQIHCGDLVFDITYQDSRHERWLVADKYLLQPETVLVQRILSDYALHSRSTVSSGL